MTKDSTWAEIERLTIQLFVDHITQIDSPFDYTKSSIGSSPSNINTITLGKTFFFMKNGMTNDFFFSCRLGLTKWHYQQIPNENAPMPYTAAREQKQIIIQLKNLDVNSTDSLAYHYFIPSQNLKNFIRYVRWSKIFFKSIDVISIQIEQNPFVGVYGAPYLQKKNLFEDLIRYFERPSSFSTSAKFQLIRLNFELLTTVDDCVDLLVNQGNFSPLSDGTSIDPNSIRISSRSTVSNGLFILDKISFILQQYSKQLWNRTFDIFIEQCIDVGNVSRIVLCSRRKSE